jgi:hypothetical protein
MNELIGHTANVMLVETNSGQLTAAIELVFLVNEAKYQTDLSGFVKTRSVTDVRFVTSAKLLRDLSNNLRELADETEELEERASLKPRDIEGA